jgi:hypothetical protein
MNLSVLLTVVGTIACVPVAAQVTSDQELARQLANESTRQDAVDKIAASGADRVPVLLSWTRMPPAQVNIYQLYVGLADVFGRLRTREAIPFLIENISLRRGIEAPPWTKMPQVVEDRLPAVGALIRIGPDASMALIRTSWETARAEERLAAIFVVSQVKDVPEARGFLVAILGEANLERFWAEEGLKLTGQDQ